MKIGIWKAIMAAHRVMGIIVTDHLNTPEDIRARMTKDFPFSEMTRNDREIVIALAWLLSWSPWDDVFEVLAQAPGSGCHDRMFGWVAGQRRAIAKVLKACVEPDGDDDVPHELGSGLRAALLRYSTEGSGSRDECSTSTNPAGEKCSGQDAPEDKRLSEEMLDTLCCTPATHPEHAEPIESILLGDAFDRLYFARNPDRQFLVREAYFDSLMNWHVEHLGMDHFVVAHRLPDGSIKKRMFYNRSDDVLLPPNSDAVGRVLWEVPTEYGEYAPFHEDFRKAEQATAEVKVPWA